MLGYLALDQRVLLVFNLIPAFPLDGGRIARAIAWKITGDRNRATRFAATLGRFGGYAMIGLGVYLWIAPATASAGSGSPSSASSWPAPRARRRCRPTFAGRIEHIRVADVMDAEPVAIAESAPLSEAEHTFFLRYGWPWFPVVDASGGSWASCRGRPSRACPTRSATSRTVG